MSSKGRSNRWQKSFAFTSFIIFLCLATTSCCIRFWHFFATSIYVYIHIYTYFSSPNVQLSGICDQNYTAACNVYTYMRAYNYLVRPFARKAYDLRRRLRIAIKRNLANARTHTHGLTYIHKYAHTHAYARVLEDVRSYIWLTVEIWPPSSRGTVFSCLFVS